MITLDKFYPRPYQLAFYDAMENSNGKYRNAIVVHPRKTGKDYGIAFQYAVRTALRSTTNILYMFKSLDQAREVIWNGLTNDGQRIIDTIPSSVIRSLNSSQLTINFNNDSRIRLGSAENWERSIVGGNASLIIFSEYATYDNDNPYKFAAPILAPRNGRFVFVTTPRGRNFFYDLWVKAQKWPDWYCERLTVDDTKHITPEMMEIMRREHSEEFLQQELYCSFDRGIEGTFYSKYIQTAFNEGRIGSITYDSTLPVNTAWDLGYNNTAIIYFQIDRNRNVRIIDFDQPTNRSLHDWIIHVKSKHYVYGKHWAPHDAGQHEYSSGVDRFSFARDLGLFFETREISGKLDTAIPRVSVDAGIERCMVSFNRISFDAHKCSYLIKSLETYHREFNEETKIYGKEPAKSWANHASDAFRYMCLVLDMHQQGMTVEDCRTMYDKAINFEQSRHGFPFDGDPYGQHFKW